MLDRREFSAAALAALAFPAATIANDAVVSSNRFDLFKTPNNLPFLFYAGYRDNLHFNLDTVPVTNPPNFDSLWRTENNPNIKKAYDHEHGRLFAANILFAAIARSTRRGMGNILFVANEQEKGWFDEAFKKFGSFNDKRVIIDTSLQPNELRATYWHTRVSPDGRAVAVDGGIQVSPEGFSCLQKTDECRSDYSDYFVRGFM